MQATIDLPQAFSIREENEFFPFQHLLERLNPKLMVHHLGTGRHVNSNQTVLWGIVYLEGEKPADEDIQAALERAGYDFERSEPIGALSFWGD